MEIYVHIPFCQRKCAYCDFLSFPADADTQKKYMKALLTEIRDFPCDPPMEVSSIYIGGGTPSFIYAEAVAKILQTIRERFVVDGDAEISMEANPGTVTADKLALYRKAGVNRISFGCQSADAGELKELGRIHTWPEFQESFRLAREMGFTNINVDLMSGIPGQTEESWERTLRAVAEMGPEHISAYSLILEEGTPLYRQYIEQKNILDTGVTQKEMISILRRKHAAEDGQGMRQTDADPEIRQTDGKQDIRQANGNMEIRPADRVQVCDAGHLWLPDEETERLMYDRTAEILDAYGYHQYEISNYAREGYACRHNIGYWTGVPYVGMGLGASSYMSRTRYRNTSDLDRYCRDCSLGRKWQALTEKDMMAEFMILGLRMTDGVSENEFLHRFGKTADRVYGDVIRHYTDLGLLERENGRIRLTRRGISLSNTVMADFLP